MRHSICGGRYPASAVSKGRRRKALHSNDKNGFRFSDIRTLVNLSAGRSCSLHIHPPRFVQWTRAFRRQIPLQQMVQHKKKERNANDDDDSVRSRCWTIQPECNVHRFPPPARRRLNANDVIPNVCGSTLAVAASSISTARPGYGDDGEGLTYLTASHKSRAKVNRWQSQAQAMTWVHICVFEV